MTPFPRGVGPIASLGAGHGALDSHPPVPIELRRDPSPRHCPPSGLEISPPQPPQSVYYRMCRLLLVGAKRQPAMYAECSRAPLPSLGFHGLELPACPSKHLFPAFPTLHNTPLPSPLGSPLSHLQPLPPLCVPPHPSFLFQWYLCCETLPDLLWLLRTSPVLEAGGQALSN